MQHGLFVMGVGQDHTPEAFVKACEVFVYTKNLSPPEGPRARSEVESAEWIPLTKRAIEMTTRDDGWAFLGAVGNALRQLDPAFDVRTYGHQRLWPLVESRSDLFELREEKTPEGPSLVYVRPAL